MTKCWPGVNEVPIRCWWDIDHVCVYGVSGNNWKIIQEKSASSFTTAAPANACARQMVVLGMDYAAWSDTYRMAQYVLGYYKTKGLVPEGKLFTSGVEVWEH